jgi:hypothetical protein
VKAYQVAEKWSFEMRISGGWSGPLVAGES